MEDKLPEGFELPDTLARTMTPWRSWACDLILRGSAALPGHLTPSERAAVDLDVFYLTREATRLGISTKALAEALKKHVSAEAIKRSVLLDHDD